MKKGLTTPNLPLLLAEVLVFAVCAVIASSHFGMADGLKITLAYLVAYLVPRTVLHHARGVSLPACVVLLVLAASLMAVDYLRLVEWTSVDGYSLRLPNLESDPRKYYKWALFHYDGSVPWEKVIFPGFPGMIYCLFKVFGVSVVWPQALNLMFTLTSVVLTGMTTRRLLYHRVKASPETLLFGGMLLYLALAYNLMMGISLLKEASIYLAITLAGFALSSMAAHDDERFRLWRDIALMALACVIMGAVRTTYLYLVLVGIVVMVLPHLRRDWGMALAMLAMVAVALLVGTHFAAYSFDRHAKIVDGGWNMQRFYVIRGTQGFYRDVIGYYFLYSPLHRAVMLPLTLSIQFFNPFPWATGGDVTLFEWLCRLSYPWYLFGGVGLFYYFVISWRRGENMGIWAWWPAISYIMLAYVMAGSVARYVLPVQPLFIPVVMFVLCRLFEGRFRKAFTLWMVVFVILVSAVLLSCLELQEQAISKALHMPPLVEYVKGLLH